MRPSRRFHYILFFATLLITLVCGIMIPHVRVNSDMTKYLPDSSPMKEGIELLREEFGYTEMDAAGVKVMFESPEPERRHEIHEKLASMGEVDGVASCKTTEDGRFTLFELNVPPSIDQKQLGRKIKEKFDGNVVVETSQDGSTPPLYVIILSFSLVIVILLAMTASWLDPLIILVSVGLAIVINIGTNALLPDVSITTNYIGAILQLVLSMDFSIILINRYRQEKGSPSSAVRAVNAAIVRAVPSVCSSALTTIVGLLMLCFMKLKIGMDMGIVLAKGVLCSLICTFTVIPAFLLMLGQTFDKAAKKVPVIPTDRLAGFCLKHKTLLSLLLVILFVTAFYFHEKTPISFSTKGESVIEKKFPTNNTAILLYDNTDEGYMEAFSESLLADSGVKTFISYPTLLGKPYTAGDMLSMVNSDGDRLSPEILRLVYFLKYGDINDIRLNLEDLAGFITGTCLNSPLLEGRIDKETEEKINLLNELAFPPQEEEKTDEPVVSEPVQMAVEPEKKVHTTAPVIEKKEVLPVPSDKISLVGFIPKLYTYKPDNITKALALFADTALMNRSLSTSEMSAVMGSTPSQTGMVYMLYKSKNGLMTPRQYVYFLCDDLFNRKGLSSMAKNEDKQDLRKKRLLMDMALADEKKTPSEIVSILSSYNIHDISESTVREIAGLSPAKSNDSLAATMMEDEAVTTEATVETVSATAVPATELATAPAATVHTTKDPASTVPASTAPTTRVPATTVPATTVPAAIPANNHGAGTGEQKPAVQTEKASIPDFGERLTAEQMADNLSALGEDSYAGLIDIVYAYYGSINRYNESWTMTLEEFLGFLTDTLLNDVRFETVLDSAARNEILEAERQMKEGISKMKGDKHSLAVIMMDLPDESPETYAAVDKMQSLSDSILCAPHYLIGESVMLNEMRHSFKKEMKLITWLTIIAILIIIIIGLRAIFQPIVLVMTVMTAVFVNVIFSGVFNGSMLYLAYLITQSMLMGATIDYGILFANYYREKRKTQSINEAIKEAYKGSLPTISTSGLIMIAATAIMAIFTDDTTISAILGSMSVGAIVTVLLILTVLPCLLAVLDKYTFHANTRRNKA